jgi:hypothetical protein
MMHPSVKPNDSKTETKTWDHSDISDDSKTETWDQSDISDECKKVVAENFSFTESDISQQLFFKLYRKCKSLFEEQLTMSCYDVLDPCPEFKRKIATEISCKKIRVNTDKTEISQSQSEEMDRDDGISHWVMDQSDVISNRILRAYEYVVQKSLKFLEQSGPTFSEIYLNKKKSPYIPTMFVLFFQQQGGMLKHIFSHLVRRYNEIDSTLESEAEYARFKELLGIFEKMLLSEMVHILPHYDQMIIIGRKKLKCVFSTIMDIYENRSMTDTEKYFAMCRYVSSTE